MLSKEKFKELIESYALKKVDNDVLEENWEHLKNFEIDKWTEEQQNIFRTLINIHAITDFEALELANKWNKLNELGKKLVKEAKTHVYLYDFWKHVKEILTENPIDIVVKLIEDAGCQIDRNFLKTKITELFETWEFYDLVELLDDYLFDVDGARVVASLIEAGHDVIEAFNLLYNEIPRDLWEIITQLEPYDLEVVLPDLIEGNYEIIEKDSSALYYLVDEKIYKFLNEWFNESELIDLIQRIVESDYSYYVDAGDYYIAVW